MAQLLQVAVVRGQAMGLSAEQAFNDIVTGIGRMSPMILDNLGIVTGGGTGVREFCRVHRQGGGRTDRRREKQALLNSVIAKQPKYCRQRHRIGHGRFQRLKASIDNAKGIAGLAVRGRLSTSAPVVVAETIDSLIEKIHGV